MIKALELKLPPGLLVALFATAIWLTHSALPLPAMAQSVAAVLALVFICLAVAILLMSSWKFFRAKTTVDPRQPMAANNLITTGLFAFSRNPIYLAFTFILIALGFWLTSALAWVWIALFITYVQRLQIIPEERLLTQRFGQDYANYCKRVRRWL